MKKKIFGKSLNILVCGLISAAILITGCADGKTAEPVKDTKQVQAAEQKLSPARNTPIVAAAGKVGPAVVGITNKAYVLSLIHI